MSGGVRGRCERGVLTNGSSCGIAKEGSVGGKLPEKGKFQTARAEKCDRLRPLGIITRDEMDAPKRAIVAGGGGADDEVGGR